MPTGEQWRRGAGFAGLVAVLVAATFSFGAIFFQTTEGGGHAHAGLTGARLALQLSADTLGVVAAGLVAAQLMMGYRMLRTPRARFRHSHLSLGWVLLAFATAHGVFATWHSFLPPVEWLPLELDALGLLVGLLVAMQLATGYRQGRLHPRARAVHAFVVVPVALLVAAHAFGAVYHVLTG
jgi:hypothetical protein